MKVATVTMTPEQATELLAHNTHNRPHSNGRIDVYAKEMSEGRWRFNGDAIRVDENGVLLDGQHRLMACVRTGVSFETLLITGLAPEVFDTIDAGAKRSAGNILAISGFTDTNVLAGASRAVLSYVRGVSINSGATAAEILELVQAHADIQQSARLAAHAKGILSPSLLTGVIFLAARQPGFDKRVAAFVDGVSTGADLIEGDPRLSLRNAFINMKMRGAPRKTTVNSQWVWSAIVLAWNAFATQRHLTLIKPTPGNDGKYKILTVVGAPAPGGGIQSLSGINKHPLVQKKLRRLSEVEVHQ